MRKVLAVILTLIMVIPVVSAGTIDGSVRFLGNIAQNTQKTRDISLALIALSSANGETAVSVDTQINELVKTLMNTQNPDGGWGLYSRETSNALDTAYAIIALRMAYPYVDPLNVAPLFNSLQKATSYLISSERKDGWGYVPGTPPYYYPTVVSLWALGESGYSYNSRVVRDALKSLGNLTCEIPQYEALALKLIAYHSLGYPVKAKTIENVRDLLLQGDNLTVKERAMLAYALVLYAPMDFNTAKILLNLEKIAKTANGEVYWANKPNLFGSTDIIASTAFATLALSAAYVTPTVENVTNPYELPCKSLMEMQNYDGGWGLYLNSPSNEKATYYALKALNECIPPAATVGRALNWTVMKFKMDEASLTPGSGMPVGYFFALETLLEHGMLNETEKAQAVKAIKEAQLEGGLWGSTLLGPQPYQTALAIKALLDLGVNPNDTTIQTAKKWLLSISNGGWGIHVQTPQFSYMLKPDVLTTITVLEALAPISTPKELQPHIQWLIKQRTGEGWAYWKEYYVWAKNMTYPGKPSVELTVRATDLLAKYGYNYTNETLNFVMDARDSGSIDNQTIETAFAIMYLSRFQYIPPVNLNNVENVLNSAIIEILAPGMEKTDVKEIERALVGLFGNRFEVPNSTKIGEDSYIAIGGFNEFNIRKYNPYLRFHVSNESITVGNITVPRKDAVVLIPGKTAEGVVLFVLSDQANYDVVKEIFSTGFIRYLHGDAMVLLKEGSYVRVIVVR
ncbi:prenyltransferase/squalene oxidase repeat-containing protein [Thermococcus sp.]|uniref:prenyltransferase/squalene oxidase repeat-containing protein n=1 Tax=Thermococcus sp. TaxID=35749 RepID=UPI0025F24C88|nr:prenyltransferase/squalene oxidase repeat-containing protein [Thermococcus sp.]